MYPGAGGLDMREQRFEASQWEEDETEFDHAGDAGVADSELAVKDGMAEKGRRLSNALVTNIVIPDYAAVMIDAFERLTSEDMEETEIYIQNVYATLFSFRHDSKSRISNMLRTAACQHAAAE